MNISIVNFSGRRNGNCHDISRFIEQILLAKHEVILFEMCNLEFSPCGKCDYECFDGEKICPYADDDIAGVYAAICIFDLVYCVVPNYIDYPNAYYFAFNERKQGFFAQYSDLLKRYLRVPKKFIVVSNTHQDNFRKILGQDILFMSSQDFEVGGVLGGMMRSDKAREIIKGFIE